MLQRSGRRGRRVRNLDDQVRAMSLSGDTGGRLYLLIPYPQIRQLTDNSLAYINPIFGAHDG